MTVLSLTPGKQDLTFLYHNYHCKKTRGVISKRVLRQFTTPTSLDVPKGFLTVYVGESEKKRIVITISYLYRPLFQDLLSKAEEEFGFDDSMGGLTLSCNEETFMDVTCSFRK